MGKLIDKSVFSSRGSLSRPGASTARSTDNDACGKYNGAVP
jgi:hypothetical protein